MSSASASRILAGLGVLVVAAAVPARPVAQGQASAAPDQITFTKHIAPILQRSCVQCHNPEGGAPMSLTTYEEVRPWARAIKMRTGLGPHAGVMPPWFVEKNIGIQRYKGDPSLSEISPLYCWMPMFFSTNQGGITPACGPIDVRVFMARAHGRTSS